MVLSQNLHAHEFEWLENNNARFEGTMYENHMKVSLSLYVCACSELCGVSWVWAWLTMLEDSVVQVEGILMAQEPILSSLVTR